MKLPVFLVHFDAPDWCRSAVASIRRSSGVVPEVVVIDNGGRPLGPLSGCTVVTSPTNSGYAGGANLALRTWRDRFPDAELAVIGSHDLHMDERCLRRLAEALESDSRLGVVGPVLVDAPRSTGGDWRRWHRSQSFDEAIATGRAPVERAWVSGTCLMLRRRCADAVGDFDGSFGSYVEDVDYCLRAADRGWAVAVVPGATAHGLGSASSRSFELIARNRLRLHVKRHPRRGAWVAIVEAMVRIPGLLARSLRASSGREAYWREAWALVRVVVAAPTLLRRWRHEVAP